VPNVERSTKDRGIVQPALLHGDLWGGNFIVGQTLIKATM
jgi:fructosamine-3-kinase